MICPQMVIYYAAKHGNDESEWEDGAAGFLGSADARPRFAVADGATQGFGSARWAQQLVAGFVGADGGGVEPPALSRIALHRWMETMQVRWRTDPRVAGANELQVRKMEEVGSLATFLGCELDLTGRRPKWTAVALGDTVLFQVRQGKLVAQFPPIPPEGFGYNPDGVPTKPGLLGPMLDRLLVAEGELADGDQLYIATDAFAHWMTRMERHQESTLWTVLAGLDHPGAFRRLVADRRACGEMDNDDVTLMRARIESSRPAHLVVCL